MVGAIPSELVARLSSLQSHGDTRNREEITEVVSALLATMEGDLSGANIKMYSELEALSQYIMSAKTEIAALRPDEIKDEHLPNATDELDAIVGATEVATNGILQAMESLESLTGEMTPEIAEKVTEAVTLVYESCNFQDITGQRITKVVKALKHIEQKVDDLVAAFGDEISKFKDIAPKKKTADARTGDAALLNGPQMPDEASKQAEIDALLASFD